MDTDDHSNEDSNLNSENSCSFNEQEFMARKFYIDYYKKRHQRSIVTILAVLSFAVFTTFVMRINAYNINAVLADFFNSARFVNVKIEAVSKPTMEIKYYDEKCDKYTTEGVAKIISPSVVSLTLYENGNPYLPVSQGSGIILTKDGYIITNAHVLLDQKNRVGDISVTLHDNKIYPADIIGMDIKTDLAVIKIFAKDLTPPEFGKSSELVVGEKIMTVGNPAGLNGSFTQGIVSALDRMVKVDENQIEMNCVQIDAAINPGNSGGALVNMYGQVVGINTSKFSSTKYDGIGFAIAFDSAKPIIESLIAQGFSESRFRIGITFNEIDKKLAEYSDIIGGLYVKEIDESCDIANSGLAIGDIITRANGKEVYTKEDLLSALDGFSPNDTVEIKVARINEKNEIATFDFKFKLMNYYDLTPNSED